MSCEVGKADLEGIILFDFCHVHRLIINFDQRRLFLTQALQQYRHCINTFGITFYFITQGLVGLSLKLQSGKNKAIKRGIMLQVGLFYSCCKTARKHFTLFSSSVN